MRQLSSLLQGLARSMAPVKERKAEEGTVLRTSGTLWGSGSETFAAVCSRRGEKGTNQDCSIVWEGAGAHPLNCEGGSTCLGLLEEKRCSVPWFLNPNVDLLETDCDGRKRCIAYTALHKIGVRMPGGHHLLRHLRRARPVGPLRVQGRPGLAAAVAAAPLAGGRRAGLAHRRREEARRLPLRPLETVLPGRRRRRRRRAPPQPAPRRRQQRLHGSVRHQEGRHDGDRERRRLASRPGDHVGRRQHRRRPADRRLQAQPASGEGAHRAVQGPRVLPRRRARRAPGVAAGPGGAGAGHVARVRRLLRQGLRRHLGAGGDAENDRHRGPVRHPRHRRGVGRCLRRRGGADRGWHAGQGEGGEAAGAVRRPCLGAQAAGLRRRRLLGDLPLPPLAAAIVDRQTPSSLQPTALP